MSKRIVMVRHGDEPHDDRVCMYFHENGFDLEVRKPFKGDLLGNFTDDVVGSVIHGGPFNVFETGKHLFLKDEHLWIEQCIAKGIPLLGICQGAQSIAHTLGANVGPRVGEPHEFGYYTVYPTELGGEIFPKSIVVSQAHFHEFEVPSGGELLAYSELFPHQAFRYGQNTFAFQFHAEVTIEGFRRWQSELGDYYGKVGSQTKEYQDSLMVAHDDEQASWFYKILAMIFKKPNNDSLTM